MDLPKRIKQHKEQSDSFAILAYRIRDLGILRNLTENDYGIDFEIELLDAEGEHATGRFFKAQVKSSDKLRTLADKTVFVGGIKQSTLNYWAEISYRVPVIAFAVDLKEEEIFFTNPLHHQVLALIDGTDTSKSIKFKWKLTHQDKARELAMFCFLRQFAFEPTLQEEILQHEMALRGLRDFVDLYVECLHPWDHGTDLFKPEVFRALLDVTKLLVQYIHYDDVKEQLSKKEHRYIYSYEYWRKASDAMGFDGFVPAFDLAKKAVFVLLPRLVTVLHSKRKEVLAAAYYWRHKNMPYLRRVHEVALPESGEEVSIRKYLEPSCEPWTQFDFHAFIAKIDHEYKERVAKRGETQ